MATTKENNDFKNALIPTDLLDDAIHWIKNNMEPEEVFDDDKLDAWATNNNYILADD